MSGHWHSVGPSEWLGKIAASYGIADEERIWSHPQNSSLRSRRDANVLYPGDQLFIPTVNVRTEQCVTEKLHRFVLNRRWEVFILQLLDGEGHPRKHTHYRLTLGKQCFAGSTDENGWFREYKIDPHGDHTGTLELPDVEMAFAVSVGLLNPATPRSVGDEESYDDGVSGIQMRLRNLGYTIPALTGTIDEHTRKILALFQLREMGWSVVEADGTLTQATRDAISDRHGC